MNKHALGIDIGGTQVKMGIVDARGQLLGRIEHPTPQKEGAEAALLEIASVAKQLATEANIPWKDIAGVGVGLPGFLDIPQGHIVQLPNLSWNDVPIRKILEKALALPVTIDNDANVAALGEAWSGAGVGVKDLICITLGTGVGGGIIANGGLVHGSTGMAGEIGHIPVKQDGALCGCGRHGCLETIASATGVMRLMQEAIARGEQTILHHDESDPLTTEKIFSAAKDKDPVAQEVVQQAVDALAYVMSILSLTFNPALFVIGGGVSKAGSTLFEPLEAAYHRRTLSYVAKGVLIRPALLGNDAGLIGAAGLTAKGEILR
ncbi:glucokinase [Marininema mesophilum]|uniref:Glucokinase n=1 Tax=Marininema mesophilum TaxID=1048340 RepID=A0A1H2TQT0_9BACL|nr:ROK family glucokinase [Marininema mesophilum]SDW46240.1 glucokinase [Marininema mesophilum]